MVVMEKVAELVHDDVLDAVNGSLDEIDVEREPPGKAAAAPARSHSADHECGRGDPMAGRNRETGVKVAGEDVTGALTVPSSDSIADPIAFGLVGHADIQEEATEFRRTPTASLNLESVLPTEVDKRLAADVPVRCGQRMECSHLVEMARDPGSFLQDGRMDIFLASGQRRVGAHIEIRRYNDAAAFAVRSEPAVRNSAGTETERVPGSINLRWLLRFQCTGQ